MGRISSVLGVVVASFLFLELDECVGVVNLLYRYVWICKFVRFIYGGRWSFVLRSFLFRRVSGFIVIFIC